jgi:hypothetical protein
VRHFFNMKKIWGLFHTYGTAGLPRASSTFSQKFFITADLFDEEVKRDDVEKTLIYRANIKDQTERAYTAVAEMTYEDLLSTLATNKGRLEGLEKQAVAINEALARVQQ